MYVTNFNAVGSDGVSQYTVGAGGALSAMATPTVAAGDVPVGVAVSPDGKSVYVADDGAFGVSGISQYTGASRRVQPGYGTHITKRCCDGRFVPATGTPTAT